ncbi:MAG: choice-of-anchor D domain-containing protein, partial [Spartobacteria bacterium]|nr:choice-of-anchor D domain-containing protein [Spartobacteria bacterium]
MNSDSYTQVVTVANSLIVNNLATNSNGGVCGGVWLNVSGGGGTSRVDNCTIVGNVAVPSGLGGGILTVGGYLQNSIVWGNTADSGADIFDAGGYFYNSCASDGLTDGADGCTTNNPMFTDASASDYTLLAGSPCIDAGDNALAPTNISPYDLAGNPRVQDGTVDMGAYEASSVPPVTYVDASRPDDSGDGASWATAKKTLQAGVDTVSATGTVWVTNGVYDAGGVAAPGLALTNRVCMTNAITVRSVNGAEVTVIEGASSAGSTGPAAVRCAYLTNGAQLVGFTLTNGYTAAAGDQWAEQSGGGVLLYTNCIVNNCILRNNTAERFADGALLYEGGALDNCLVMQHEYGIFAQKGGVARNCTSVQNDYGLYINGFSPEIGAIYNCISWSNTASDFAGSDAGNIPMYNTCFQIGGNYGTDTITNNPLFVDYAADDFSLQAASPCINAGNNAYAPTNVSPYDLAGFPRILDGTVDAGAYEFLDGYYVDASRPDDSGNGFTWATAKQTIQAAVDIAVAGKTVWVTNGLYNTGGALTPGYALTNRVCVTKAITVRSVNGPDVTSIVGAGPVGASAVRGVFMTNGATLAGFTVTNGFTLNSGSTANERMGGGVFVSGSSTVSNCVLTGCSGYRGGGGAYLLTGAKLNNCIVSGNASLGGMPTEGGGGVYNVGGELNNCLLTTNTAGSATGGGVYNQNGTLNNCTLYGNVGTIGGGVYNSGGTLNNCIAWANIKSGPAGFDIYNSGGAVNYSCASDGLTDGVNGCSTNNPLFTSAANEDYTIQTTSPCFNTGENTYAPTNITPYDLAGNPRIAFGTVDMGAYEVLTIISSSIGPYAGGNSITISNGVAIGSGADITNVTVGGVAATVTGQGANWVTITLPAASSAGVKDIVIQSTSLGDSTLVGAYTYNPMGEIYDNTVEGWQNDAGLPINIAWMGSAELDGYLYSISGSTDGSDFITNCYRFNGSLWESIAGLPQGFQSPVACAFQDRIYCMGGSDSIYTSTTNVFCYDGTNWSAVEGFSHSNRAAAAVVWNDRLYVVGGTYDVLPYTNVFVFDGTNWAETIGLPIALQGGRAGVVSNRLIFAGGYSGAEAVTNVYAFDGATWMPQAGLPEGRYEPTAAMAYDQLFVMGGNNTMGGAQNNVYAFDGAAWHEWSSLPYGLSSAGAGFLNELYIFGGYNMWGNADSVCRKYVFTKTGLTPTSGSWTGGYPVVIGGTNLCNGSLGDVTLVTICGFTATVDSVTGSTQIVVTAGVATNRGYGDVRVYSTSHGETVKSNFFSYSSSEMFAVGTNAADIASGEVASAANGTDFGNTAVGAAITNKLSLKNSGNIALNITGYVTNGPDAALFSVTGVPASLPAWFNNISNIVVTYAPTALGSHTASLVFTNNSLGSPFILNLAGSGYGLSPNNGPYAGGNTITITNGNLGNGFDITNVTVGGVAATITGQTASSVTITLPTATSSGAKDIVIQSTSVGETTLANAYTYNPQGRIAPANYEEYRVEFRSTISTEYPSYPSPDGTYTWTQIARDNDWKELQTTNGTAGGVYLKPFDYPSGTTGGWGPQGYDWIAEGAANTFIYVNNASLNTNYVVITNLPGSSYRVDVVNAYSSSSYPNSDTLHAGIYQPGTPADNGNYGNWPSGGNTNAGKDINVLDVYNSQSNYVTW